MDERGTQACNVAGTTSNSKLESVYNEIFAVLRKNELTLGEANEIANGMYWKLSQLVNSTRI